MPFQSSLSESDVASLRTILESGNRGEFYWRYYEMTGEYQALIQAQITTYSGVWGGLAASGNYLAKLTDQKNYTISLDQFSYDIAAGLLLRIESDVSKGGSGIFTADEMLAIDQDVWRGKGLGELFPGITSIGPSSEYFQDFIFRNIFYGVEESVFDFNVFNEKYRPWELGKRLDEFDPDFYDYEEGDRFVRVYQPGTENLVFIADKEITDIDGVDDALIYLLADYDEHSKQALDPNSEAYAARQAIWDYTQSNQAFDHKDVDFIPNQVPPNIFFSNSLRSEGDYDGVVSYHQEFLNRLIPLDSESHFHIIARERFIGSFSNDRDYGIEEFLISLEKIFLGSSSGSVSSQEQYEARSQSLLQSLGGAGYGFEAIYSHSNIFSKSKEDTSAGRAYRYALVNLLPFALTENISGLDIESAEYDFGKLSDEYLIDREKMLKLILEVNESNGDFSESLRPNEWSALYVDMTTDKRVATGNAVVGSPIDDNVSRIIFGTDGNDNPGGNLFSGNKGSDHLYGGGGLDELRGREGDDYLDGGDYNDLLYGGKDNDKLRGGEGNDTFYFVDGDGIDTILDGDTGGDRIIINDDIDLSSLTFERSEGGSLYKAEGHDIRLGVSDTGEAVITYGDTDVGMITLSEFSDGDYGINLSEKAVPDFDQNSAFDLYSDFSSLWWGKFSGFAELHDITGDVGIYRAFHNSRVNNTGYYDLTRFNRIITTGYDSYDFDSSITTETDNGFTWRMDAYYDLEGVSYVHLVDPDRSHTFAFEIQDMSLYYNGQLIVDNIPGEPHPDQLINFEGGDQSDYLFGSSFNEGLFGGLGDDQIFGEDGDDILTGGQGNDYIKGGNGQDYIFANQHYYDIAEYSEDHILYEYKYELPDATNELYGGAGDDFISGERGIDYIDGGESDTGDVLVAGYGSDIVEGGTGTDTVFGDSRIYEITTEFETIGDTTYQWEYPVFEFAENLSNNELTTFKFNDQINGGDDADSLAGELGDDTILGGKGDDIIEGDRYGVIKLPDLTITSSGGAPDRVIEFELPPLLDPQLHGNDYIDGGEGNDRIHGQGGDDVLIGGSGDDQLYGDDTTLAEEYHGDDEIDGGDGNDTIYAGAGNDAVYGGKGVDSIFSEAGDDLVYGGEGNDHIETGEDEDTVYGGEGEDTIAGGMGNDYLDGGSGDDLLFGQENDDTLLGGAGNDQLSGDAGNDTLFGGAGNDNLYGGEGDDTFIGGTGLADTYSGGAGNDTYIYNQGDENVIIESTSGNDVLKISDGFSPSSVRPYRFNNNLILSIIGTDNIINVLNYFADYALDQVEFADGTVWGSTEIKEMVLTGSSGDDNIIGYDESDDTIYGNNGNDTISGHAGSDTIYGGFGDDSLTSNVSGSSVNDGINQLYGGYGNDSLFAGGGTDSLYGEFGNDFLISGAGNTTLYGGLGDDTYNLFRERNNNTVVELEGEGYDTIITYGGSFTLPDNVERLVVNSDSYTFNRNMIGNQLDNVIQAAEDLGSFLDGKEGADLMWGGNLDDVYVVDNIGDITSEARQSTFYPGDGHDIAYVFIDGYKVGYGIEELRLVGGAGQGIGNNLDNILDATGSHFIHGYGYSAASSTATLQGGIGNDTYRIKWGQSVVENAGEGIDAVEIFNAGNQVFDFSDIDNVEDIYLKVATWGTLIGNDEGNLLFASDRQGYQYADTLIGGKGNDKLWGGQGNDTYEFSLGDGRDVISDYQDGASSDKIVFDNSIDLSDLSFELHGIDLKIITSSTDSITIERWGSAGVSALEVMDGASLVFLSKSDIDALATQAVVEDVKDFALEDTDKVFTFSELLDGANANGFTVTGVANAVNGSVVIDSVAETVTFTPDANFHGRSNDFHFRAFFDFTVSDGSSSHTASVHMGVGAIADVVDANDDSISVSDAGPITINTSDLLSNDIDPDSELHVESVFNAVNGTVEIDAPRGIITFTPDEGFSGLATFDYRVTDGKTFPSPAATVSLNIDATNTVPTANDDLANGSEDTPIVINVADLLGNDSDIDGDDLTITSVDNSSNGVAVLDSVAGTITFTPDTNYSGSASFDYTVSDGQVTDTATVNIAVDAVNDAPTAGNDTIAATEDQAMVISFADLLANDSDVEGDSLTITGASNASNGTITLDTVAETITFTPDAGYNGSASFEYTLSDGTNTSTASVDVTVNPVNDAPVAGDDTAAATEDAALVLNVANLLGNDSDADGDNLSITAVSNASNGTVALDSVAGTITFTPDADYNGPASFDYTVSDGTATDTATVDITVGAMNDAPEAGDDTSSATEDTAVVINVADLLTNDSDIDGDNLSVTAVSNTSNGTAVLDSVAGTVTFTPDANYHGPASFEYTVSDGVSTDTAIVNITVGAANDAPVAGDDAVTATEDQASFISFADLLTNDSDVDGDNLTVTAVSNASNGAVSLDVIAETITFTPDAGYSGPASFDYTVSDGVIDDTATVSVTVEAGAVNTAPVASDDAETITESSLDIDVADLIANDSDPDGDSLAITSVGAAVNGSVSLDTVAGTITFTPDSNYYGPASFEYTVSDGADSDTATVNIDIQSDAFNLILGSAADETLNGTSANDHLQGNEGADILSAGNGDDQLMGNSGNDNLKGGKGKDTLYGGIGNDVLNGQGGNDTLVGGQGNDTLYGGGGSDLYEFTWGDGQDTLRESKNQSNTDVVEFKDVAFDELWFSQDGNHLIVDLIGTDDQIKIRDWFSSTRQIEEFKVDNADTADDFTLLKADIDQLVNAMAAFDVPDGVGAVVSEDVKQQLESTLTAVWQ